MTDKPQHLYRIIKPNGYVKFTGTDTPSFFATIERAREYADIGDKVYEVDILTHRQMWEIC